MYRGMPPGGPQAPPVGSRLDELLANIRQEFDQQAQAKNEADHHMESQIREVDLIHTKIYQLQQTHVEMKKQYETEIARLRHELEQRGGPAQGPHGNPSVPPAPPAIGHGPSNLFSGIMAGSGQGGPGLVPPPQEQQGAPGMPGHMQGQVGGPPPPPPALSGPPGPPHNPFGQYGQPHGPAINGSPAVARPTPPPNQVARYQAPDFQYNQAEIEQIGNQLSDYEPEKLPPHLKRQGDDWHAVFNPNPNVRRRLDVELVHNLAHQSVVCCVRFSQNGRFVATGCNRSAQIFDVRTGEQICHLQDPNTSQDGDLYIRSVCFSPDGRYLATGAEDKIIRVWDIEQRQIRYQFAGHDQDIYSLDFASDGIHIASGSGDRTIRVWNIQENRCVVTLSIEDGVTTVAMSPDGQFVAAGSLDKCVRMWDVQTGNMVEKTDGEQAHQDSVYSVAFAPKGGMLVSGSLDKTIRMWKLKTHYGGVRSQGECIRTFEGHKDFVLSVALTPDGQWVMSGSKDRGVQFWDPDTGHAQLMLQGHKNSVISVAPSPHRDSMGGLFATGSGDMKARIWRYTDYRAGP